MDERTLGKRLQLARRRAGLTQQALCQKAGLSYSTLAKIERGAIRSPSIFTVVSIAGATDTPLEDLLDIKSSGLRSPAPAKPKKRSKTGVRFVYIDVNGTLVRFFHKAFTEIARLAGKPTDIVETFYWRHNSSVESGQMSLEELNSVLGDELGLENFDWGPYYLDNVEPMPGIKELVNWIAEYYELGILSDNMPGFIEELRERDIIPAVDYTVVVDSSKVGITKTDPKMYETAQQLASAEAGEILLIDNTRQNLIVADRTGWQVVWFDEFNPEDSIARVRKALEF